ncbi:MAG: Gfo/Idh/MocA family oxidoreductase [Pseudomonadota bacterium]
MRTLVIGAGAMGARHAARVRAHPGARLVGIVEPDEARARGLADADVQIFASLEEAQVEADAAIIATPNDAHANPAEACARRGLTTLVEKPIAATLMEADRIVAAARRAPMLVGHHRRHHPAAQMARELIAAGAIGRPVAASLVWALRKPDTYFETDWRRGAAGGPALINLIHDVDLLRFLLGEVVEVAALSSDHVRQGPVEDSVAVALRLRDGPLATALLSDAALSPVAWEAATSENPAIAGGGRDPYQIFGTEGTLSIPSLRLWRHEGEGRADWSAPLSEIALEVPPADPFALQLDHLIAVAAGRAKPMVTAADARASLAATLAVLEAAATGQTIPLKPSEASHAA